MVLALRTLIESVGFASYIFLHFHIAQHVLR